MAGKRDGCIHKIPIGSVPGIGLFLLALRTGQEADELAERFMWVAIEEACLRDEVLRLTCTPLMREALLGGSTDEDTDYGGATGRVRVPGNPDSHRLEDL